MLRRFNHSRALSAATRSRIPTKRASVYAQPQVQLRLAVGVVRELARRDVLAAATAGRTPQQLGRLLRFVRRNVWRREGRTPCLLLYHCILGECGLVCVCVCVWL